MIKEIEEQATAELYKLIRESRSPRDALKTAREELRVMEAGRGVHELEAEIRALEETVQSSPARKLIKYIRRTGEYKGEIVDFTPEQYRAITGKMPATAIVRRGKIPWEWALDDIASELKYSSDEALKKDIEKTLKLLHRIDDLKRERGIAADLDVKRRVYEEFIEGLERELVALERHRPIYILPRERSPYFWNISELREMCRTEGLPDYGDKHILVERLRKVKK